MPYLAHECQRSHIGVNPTGREGWNGTKSFLIKMKIGNKIKFVTPYNNESLTFW